FLVAAWTSAAGDCSCSAARLAGWARWWHFLVFAVIYLYAFPYFDRLRNANEMPRILMTKAIVDRGVLNIDPSMGELQSLSDTSVAPNGHRYPNKAPG